MSSFQEQKREEESLFAKEAPQNEAASLQGQAERERDEGLLRQTALTQSLMAAPDLAPHVQAEMPRDGVLSPDSAERLFQHYAERAGDDGEQEEQQTTAQVDVRQRSRSVFRKTNDIGDMIQDGIDGNFVADSAFVAADLDTHNPAADAAADAVIDGWTGRRRRAELLGEDPLQPAESDQRKQSKQDKQGKEGR